MRMALQQESACWDTLFGYLGEDCRRQFNAIAQNINAMLKSYPPDELDMSEVNVASNNGFIHSLLILYRLSIMYGLRATIASPSDDA